MTKVYVYSTLAASVAYTAWERGGPNDMPKKQRRIVIAGGTGIADRHFMTPWGVLTTITPEEFGILQENDKFKRHMERGYIRVSSQRLDPESAAADMALSDPSLPLVPEDYQGEDEGPKPAGMDTDRPGTGGSHKNRSRKRTSTGPRSK